MKNFKQFTTINLCMKVVSRCLWWFKDEEFQAIHNKCTYTGKDNTVVYDGSKMKNFKQFTTRSSQITVASKLSMMVQRWRISSNSQHQYNLREELASCLWWFKDEEFQAIHNRVLILMNIILVVYDGSKMKNFKQFTTVADLKDEYNLLSMMVQRWRISSNSQRVCKKDIIKWVVYDGSKMKNFKQFTTINSNIQYKWLLSMMVQRWRISSNSQQVVKPLFCDVCCLWWFKDEEFQAIHN